MLPRARGPLMQPHRGPRLQGGSRQPLARVAALAAAALLLGLAWLFLRSPPGAGVPGSRAATLADRLRASGLAASQGGAVPGAGAGGTEAARAAPIAAQSQQQQQQQQRQPWAPPEAVAAAGQYLQDAVLRPPRRPAAPAAQYVIDPEPHDMRSQHAKVRAYLSSPGFRERVERRRAGGGRGVIINAGGPQLVASAAATLKVLREVFNCSLPVELVWHRPGEMDQRTLQALARRWGPLRGVDLSATPWPDHQRRVPMGAGEAAGAPGGANGTQAQAAKFVGKVWSLAASSFASALLLDADSLPLANPEELWQDAGFQQAGCLFWPDFWAPTQQGAEQREVVFDMVGLKHPEAEELLAAGKGRLRRRGTESGQLLVDLVAHADVAEWALWANSFGDQLYHAVWGDKDTWGLALAVAGKAHLFHQLQVPPGGAFAWRPGSLQVKATGEVLPGWQLAGMVQHDALGRPAFLHRTMNKLTLGGTPPWPLGLLTGPLPLRWVHYYLSQESLGPTVGVPYDYVAPASAFTPWRIPPPLSRSRARGGEWAAEQEEACPAATFVAYWRLREHALPTGGSPALDAACAPLLRALLGEGAGEYEAAGLLQQPQLLALGSAGFDELLAARRQPNPLVPEEELPDSGAVLAWEPDYSSPAVDTPVACALRGSYDAMEWLQQHAGELPLLQGAAAAEQERRQQPQQQQPQQQPQQPPPQQPPPPQQQPQQPPPPPPPQQQQQQQQQQALQAPPVAPAQAHKPPQ